MSTIITNFSGPSRRAPDLIRPESYQTFIPFILKLYNDNLEVKQAQTDIVDHANDFNDPHNDAESLSQLAIQKVWEIYYQMVPNPVSLDVFKSTVVTSPYILEIIRVIYLNRALYDKVKLSDGTVPGTVSASLSKDYRIVDNPDKTETWSIGALSQSDYDFNLIPVRSDVADNRFVQKLGDDLEYDYQTIVFSTSSTSPCYSSQDQGSGYSVDLKLAANAFGCDLTFVGNPDGRFTILSFSNGTQTIRLDVDQSRQILVSYNGNDVFPTGLFCTDGKLIFEIGLDCNGTLWYQHDGIVSTIKLILAPYFTSPLTTLTLGTSVVDLSYHGYGVGSQGTPTLTDGTNDLYTEDGTIIQMTQFGIQELCVYVRT